MLTLENNTLYYKPSTPAHVQLLKTIGGRWDYKHGAVALPPIYASIAGLSRVIGEYRVDHSVASLFEPYGFKTKHPDTYQIANAILYPYQRDAVSFLTSSPHHGAILSLSPGLGKTLTAIAAAVELDAQKVLVISPLTLLNNWIREIKKWACITATNCYGEVPDGDGWFVTNYDTVVKYADQYIEQCYDIIIIDESVLIKNRKTKRAKAILALSQCGDKVWLLSGAPVTRHADDLFMQLRTIAPEYFTSYWRFVDQYCVTEQTIWGTKVVGTKPNINFLEEFKDLIFVRNQKDVLPDLPDMLFERYEVALTGQQRRMYEQMRDDFIIRLLNGEIVASTRLAQIARLQQVVSCPEVFGDKIVSAKYELLRTLLQNEEIPLPTIIWVNFQQTADTLRKFLSEDFPELRIALIDGNTPGDERSEIINNFQSGIVDIIILSLGTGKYGITLTEARGIVYYDKTFDGDAYLQSLARVQRIGLRHVPVVFSIRAKDSVDSLIELNLAGKMESIHKISNNDLATLLRGLT